MIVGTPIQHPNEVAKRGALLSLVIPIPGIVFGLIYGFKGNELVRKNLSNRGFKNKKDIKAKNPDDALAIFYDEENEK